ncbi:MAG: hypothetical protein ABTQ26_04185 [Azonexus sp.]
MNIDDRKQRHARAMNLFESEAREQQLLAIALRQAIVGPEGAAPNNTPDDVSPADPVAGLHALDRAAEANILNAHTRLRSARMQAARMAASDPELARLNTLIDGAPTEPSGLEPRIIEGEVIEITIAPAEPGQLSDHA